MLFITFLDSSIKFKVLFWKLNYLTLLFTTLKYSILEFWIPSRLLNFTLSNVKLVNDVLFCRNLRLLILTLQLLIFNYCNWLCSNNLYTSWIKLYGWIIKPCSSLILVLVIIKFCKLLARYKPKSRINEQLLICNLVKLGPIMV